MTSVELHEEEALGKAYDARLMRRLMRYLRPYRRLVAAALGLLIISGALNLVGPLLTRYVIDVALPAGDLDAVWRAAAIFFAAMLAGFACEYGETILTSLLGQRVMRDLRVEIFAQLQRLSIAFFDRNPVGRLVTRVTSDVEALNELFTAGVVAGLGDLFTLAAISVVMIVIDWRLALASFVVIPLVVLVSLQFQKRVRTLYREIRTRLARINAFLQERLTGMRIVQLFGRERDESKRFDDLNRSHLDAHLRSITVYALYFPAIEILTSIALASLIVAGATGVAGNTMTIGTVAAFLQLVRRFFQPLQDLSEKYNILQGAMAASERIFLLLDTPPTVRDKGESEIASSSGPGASKGEAGIASSSGPSASGAIEERTNEVAREVGPPPTGREEVPEVRLPTAGSEVASPSRSPQHAARSAVPGVTVEFLDVWFAYDVAHVAAGGAPGEQPEWALRGVSFRAQPGETIALVGHTGAGKTTVISLLMRFYDPQKGRILIDGVDIREMPLAELRALIGYVQQDIFLFAGDIASNIRLSAPLAHEQVVAAAERVGADRLIRRLPQGYAHELGERGASISVGERQLLSFARAIAADPALLLLDEATSAVDSEIEAEIQRAIAELMRGRTTIAVAHRLSTIVSATEILVMHHGQIVERGTHRALLERGGLYERLYRLQTGESPGLAQSVP